MSTAVRTSSADVEAARRLVEDLVCDTPGGREGELSFEEPWEIRAFAMAVAGHQAGRFTWDEFQAALIASIDEWEAAGGTATSHWSYYVHWLTALEVVMARSGDLPRASLDERTSHVLATTATANHHAPHHDPIAIDPAR